MTTENMGLTKSPPGMWKDLGTVEVRLFVAKGNVVPVADKP
jgi:hypothetical protein